MSQKFNLILFAFLSKKSLNNMNLHTKRLLRRSKTLPLGNGFEPSVEVGSTHR